MSDRRTGRGVNVQISDVATHGSKGADDHSQGHAVSSSSHLRSIHRALEVGGQTQDKGQGCVLLSHACEGEQDGEVCLLEDLHQ